MFSTGFGECLDKHVSREQHLRKVRKSGQDPETIIIRQPNLSYDIFINAINVTPVTTPTDVKRKAEDVPINTKKRKTDPKTMSIEEPAHPPCSSKEPKQAPLKNAADHHRISSPRVPSSSDARNVILVAAHAPQSASRSTTSTITPETVVPTITAAAETQPFYLY